MKSQAFDKFVLHSRELHKFLASLNQPRSHPFRLVVVFERIELESRDLDGPVELLDLKDGLGHAKLLPVIVEIFGFNLVEFAVQDAGLLRTCQKGTRQGGNVIAILT